VQKGSNRVTTVLLLMKFGINIHPFVFVE